MSSIFTHLIAEKTATIGKETELTISDYDSLYTYSITVVIGDHFQESIVWDLQQESYTWTVPDEIYDLIPNARSIQGFYSLSVYQGSQRITEVRTPVTFLTDDDDCFPIVQPTVYDTWDNVIGVTGDRYRIVNIYNKVQVLFNTTAKHGATIVSKKVTCGSKSLANDGIMENVNSDRFVFEVRDSRGYGRATTISVPFVNYFIPSVALTVGDIMPNGECTIKMTGSVWQGNFGVKENDPAVHLYYAEQGAEYPSPNTPSYSATIATSQYNVQTTLTGLDRKKTYKFYARVQDTLVGTSGQKTQERIISSDPVFFWSNKEFIFNVPVYFKQGFNDLFDNAGSHNAVYRGKNLGTSVTDAQWAAIANGTFADLYIGDYWVINGVNWRIAAFDYYLKTGDISCTAHHAVIVPDASLYDYAMNDSNTTAGGYVGSKMYTEGLAQAKMTINSAFGSAHILSHRQLLVNAVTDGKPSVSSWYDSTVELMTEQNVYGGKIFGAGNDGSTVPSLYTIDKSQFPLFAYDPLLISNRQWFWLRDVVSDAHFAYVDASGYAAYPFASAVSGVRPAFAIKS